MYISNDCCNCVSNLCHYSIITGIRVNSVSKHILCIISDSIEANVEKASSHVEQGAQQLSKASEYQVKFELAFDKNHVVFLSVHLSVRLSSVM